MKKTEDVHAHAKYVVKRGWYTITMLQQLVCNKQKYNDSKINKTNIYKKIYNG